MFRPKLPTTTKVRDRTYQLTFAVVALEILIDGFERFECKLYDKVFKVEKIRSNVKLHYYVIGLC